MSCEVRRSVSQIIEDHMKPYAGYDRGRVDARIHREGLTAFQLAEKCASGGWLRETYACLQVHCESGTIDLFGMYVLQTAARVQRDRQWEIVTWLESGFGRDTEDKVKELKQKVENLTALMDLFEYLRETHRYEYRGNVTQA